MSVVFKVHQLTSKTKVDILYVFNNTQTPKELDKLFETNPLDKQFQTVFTKDELEAIRKHNTKVRFINQFIHYDDSIGIVKLKICAASERRYAIEEMYLFALNNKQYLQPALIYQQLTQNEKRPLTKARINLLMSNLYDEKGVLIDNKLVSKDQYSFDDILRLNLSNHPYLVSLPLGQLTFDPLFIANPYLVTDYPDKGEEERPSNYSTVLLDGTNIVNNNIYLCLAQDVLSTQLVTEYTSKLYYPMLYNDRIETAEMLANKHKSLLEATLRKLTPETEKSFENINLFYDIFSHRTASNVFTNNLDKTGITYLKITIQPLFQNIKIPIDVLFKLLRATQDFPFIKYNPDTKQENMYRLFAPTQTKDGQKIPFLSKTTIFKLMRLIGKQKSIAVYSTVIINSVPIQMVCEFGDNGGIMVYPLDDFTPPVPLPFDHIDHILQETVNPLIEQINPFFEQIGMEYPMFHTIASTSTITIHNIKFQLMYNIVNPVNLHNLQGCLTSAFVIESESRMRFKRVSNFNKNQSQEAFIIEKIDNRWSHSEIVEQLMQQYSDLDMQAADELVRKVTSELEGMGQKRIQLRRINPGIETIFEVNKITSELTITMNGLKNIHYLFLLPVYIDTIVRITQDINSCGINVKQIKQKCSDKEIVESTIHFEDPLPPPPLLLPDNTNLDADADNNIDDLLNMLGIEEDNLFGGEKISDDSSSVIRKPNPTRKRLLNENISDDSSSAELSDISLSSNKDSSAKLSDMSDKQAVELDGIFIDTPQSVKTIEEEESIDLPHSPPTIPSILTKESPVESTLSDSSKEEKPVEVESTLSDSSKEENPVEVEATLSDSSKEEKPVEANSPKEQSIEEEEEEEEIIINPKKKNKKKIQNTVRNITGMKLQYKNPFLERLETKMPQLFVKSKNDKIDLYTRMCAKQPVILTEKEKERILRDHPGEINEEAEFVKYGTDANSKPFYYTCPRYWCLLTDTMVTEQDILDGKCGPKVNNIQDVIIPKGSATVPEGKYVYQFYGADEKNYPGFHSKQMPSGLCIPCCYANWDTKAVKTRRNICQGNVHSSSAEETKEEMTELDYYVKGAEKYGPQLGEHRWGFLPVAVQTFLQIDNNDCKVDKASTALKPNHMCILRHGVENHPTQSFIACIASARFYVQKDNHNKPLLQHFLPHAKTDVPTIKQMKQLLIDAMTLDTFVKYQNGDLVTSFANPDIHVEPDDYIDSALYKNHSEKNSQKAKQFLQKVVQAFKNFQAFLNDDQITIDYTYLWDLICIPNPRLFETGINLIILNIPENDLTNNIELVCPTNYYSNHTYDARSRSLFLIQRENYFEPLYGYFNDKDKIHIIKTFSEYDKTLPSSMRSVFTKLIKPTLGEKCKPFGSMKEYRFKQAPLLDTLIKELTVRKYKVLKQVLNFQAKVVGVIAKQKEGLEGFIPCFPSALSSEEKNKHYDFVYMDDPSIWQSYEQTLAFLKHYFRYKDNSTNNRFFQVIHDKLIIGFLTDTDQFIPIEQPVPQSSVLTENIETISGDNMLVADIDTLLNPKADRKRVEFIQKIQLETYFYNMFRKTIRLLVNDYSNLSQKNKLKAKSNAKYIVYATQLKAVIRLLRELAEDTILFTELPPSMISENLENTDILFTNDQGQLVLPIQNLVTGKDNDEFYYGRMADELIRYNRVKSFMFNAQSFLSFDQLKYNLQSNELLILQSLLTQEYFDRLKPSEINSYAKYITYDTAMPILSQPFNNKFKIDSVQQQCHKSSPMPITSIRWEKCFPNNQFQKIEYTCPLQIFLEYNHELTVQQIKTDLIAIYHDLISANEDRRSKIEDIWREEGQILETDFESLILSNDFRPVTFDLWLLLDYYQIPSVFISSKPIAETRFNSYEFVCYTRPETHKYLVLMVPPMYKRKPEKTPKYGRIVEKDNDDNDNLWIDLSHLQCFQTALTKHIQVEHYIDVLFQKDVTTKYKPRKKGIRLLLIEDDEDENEEIIEVPIKKNSRKKRGDSSRGGGTKTRKKKSHSF